MEPRAAHPGDELIPDANLVFDRSRTIGASPDAIWPWLVQLGKRRAGWYLPRRLERLVPAHRRALHRIDGAFQQLVVGDRIPDYGGRDAHLEVARIEPPHLLIYRDQRRGAPFSWAISLTPLADGRTRVDLRFRGRLRSTGIKRRLLVTAGDLLDMLTSEAMLRGLAERLRGHSECRRRPP